MLWDSKDVSIIAQAIISVAPEDRRQAAHLVIAAAEAAGIDLVDLDCAVMERQAETQPY